MIEIDLSTDALLVVDAQTAFMPEHVWDGQRVKAGGLPVPGGHEIVSAVLKSISLFPYERRFASCDQHPRGHISWASSYSGYPEYYELTLDEVLRWTKSRVVSPRFDLTDLRRYLVGTPGRKQTLWPDHAPYNTDEALLHPAIRDIGFRLVLIKGMDPTCDSYSAERDNLGRSTGLAEQMEEEGVKRVFMNGNAYTHCVGWGALGFAERGFEVFVMKDATRSVVVPGLDLEGDMDRQLAAAGVHVISTDELALKV